MCIFISENTEYCDVKNFPSIKNGRYTTSEFSLNSKFTAVCDEGYVLENKNSVEYEAEAGLCSSSVFSSGTWKVTQSLRCVSKYR